MLKTPQVDLLSIAVTAHAGGNECGTVSGSTLTQGFAPTGVASSGCWAGMGSGITDSQSQPSFKQARTLPIFVFFSTINGAPHFGHGSARGMCGVVKSQSG